MKMNRYRWLMLGLILALAVTPVFGSGNGEEESEVVTVRMGLWGNETETTIKRAHAENVAGMYPELAIEIQRYPDSVTFWDRLPGEIAAGTAPDFLSLTNEGAFEYLNQGLFAPLNEYIEEAGLDMSDYVESALEVWTKDGQIYGFPVGGAPAMFIVNQQMWEDAGLGDYPATWEEVREAARVLTTEDTKGIIVNIHEFHLTNYMLSFGGGWNYGATINSPQNVEALEFIFSLFEEGLAATPKEAGFGWDGEAFAAEVGAMSTGGRWYKGFLASAGPDMDFTFLPMPEGTSRGCTLHSSANVVIADGENKLMATIAAHYMTENALQAELMEVSGSNPQKNSLSARYYEVNPEFEATRAILPYAQDFAYPAETKRFYDVLVRAVEARILGMNDKSAQQVLDDVQAQFN